MFKRKHAVPVLAVAAVAFVGACAEAPVTQPSIDAPDAPSLFATPANPQADLLNTFDARLAGIADEVPGFAGFYFADGALNVVMTASAQAGSAAAVRSALGRELGALGIDLDAQPLRTQVGQYDFRELHTMHTAATGLLSIPTVVFTDADEVRNQITIGVEDAATAATVASQIEMLGLPASAVNIVEMEPILPMQTLQQRVRPVAGGLQINFPGFLCTLGFNVRSPNRPNVHGFVTNSHCTSAQWQFNPANPTPYAQPSGVATCPAGDNCIGYEAHDAPGTTGGACPAGRICRNSDAAGVRYLPGVENAFARIYRTTGFGSLTIDPTSPMFTIVAEAPTNLAVGDSVHKVGRTTGWSRGTVTASCANTNVGGTNFTTFCQDWVTAPTGSVAGGDSGSGAWTPSPLGQLANVRLNGILWGGSGSTIFVYSPMQRVRMDNPPPPGAANWTVYPGQTF
jgi:hypothetical protein